MLRVTCILGVSWGKVEQTNGYKIKGAKCSQPKSAEVCLTKAGVVTCSVPVCCVDKDDTIKRCSVRVDTVSSKNPHLVHTTSSL